MAGTRVSVAGALEAVATAVALGILPGLASAWLGRRFEWFALRVTDTLMVIAVHGLRDRRGRHPRQRPAPVDDRDRRAHVARCSSASPGRSTLGLRQQQYVEAAELMGASQWWILRNHIWGKVLPDHRGHHRPGHRHRAAGRGVPDLPRPRRHPAGADLGRHARQRPGLPRPAAVGAGLPRPAHHAHASAPSTCSPTPSARPPRTPSAAPGGAGGPSTPPPASSPERPSGPR